ncbi:hypothetical protein BOX15_Mlig008336g1, partial [Macrostomum lignano]
IVAVQATAEAATAMSKKAEANTPKAISNRIKAKGLQKLRWYCEMCQKQCRDENGFKCHTMSESHQRQLLLFAETPEKYIEDYSKEFLKGYTDLLRRQFGCKRVLANSVYQEYIKDRNHVHMNATKWHTLTGLVQWLGREGICKVDETERGWYVQYLERDPEQERRQRGKERLELTDAEMQQRQIDRQIEWGRMRAAEAAAGGSDVDGESNGPTELLRPEGDGDGGESQQPIKINLALKRPAPAPALQPQQKIKPAATPAEIGGNALARAEQEAKKRRKQEQQKQQQLQQQKKPRSAVEELREELEREKCASGRSWLSPGLVVRVVDPGRPDWHRRKATVESTTPRGARLRFLDDDQVEKRRAEEVAESRLETVLPALGGRVRVVLGSFKGRLATLLSLQEADYACTVRLEDGPYSGKTVSGLAYEQVCKLAGF